MRNHNNQFFCRDVILSLTAVATLRRLWAPEEERLTSLSRHLRLKRIKLHFCG